MHKTMLKFLFLIGFLIPQLGLTQQRSWQEQMQMLATSLTDIFPFLYSPREFRDSQNQKALKQQLSKLASLTHTLPQQQGELLIGAEPLLSDAKESMQSDFKKAIQLFNKKDFDSAQAIAQKAVQRCFACHTAHQVGPNFSATSSEVMNLATPFVMGKVMVFGALRQFGGALELLESEIKKPKSARNASLADLAKLHLVVSLRGLQDFSRAQKLMETLQNQKEEAEVLAVLKGWSQDLQEWKSNRPRRDPQNMTALQAFVLNLRESRELHGKVSSQSMSAKDRATTYRRLGQLYRALGVPQLVDLSQLYFTACEKENASPELNKLCQEQSK